ncbi:unnamed protein product, partial [marine sediment metagenome]
ILSACLLMIDVLVIANHRENIDTRQGKRPNKMAAG